MRIFDEACLNQGAVLLSALGPDVARLLSRPFATALGLELRRRFEGCQDPRPERLRAAAAVSAVTRHIEHLHRLALRPRGAARCVVIRDDGSAFYPVSGGKEEISFDDFAVRIASEADVDPDTGDLLWRTITRLVREGKLHLPDLAAATALLPA